MFRFTGKTGKINNGLAEIHSSDPHVEWAKSLATVRLQRQPAAGISILLEQAMREEPEDALASEILRLMHLPGVPVQIQFYHDNTIKALPLVSLYNSTN